MWAKEMTDAQESMGTTSGLILEENIKYKLQDGEMAKEKENTDQIANSLGKLKRSLEMISQMAHYWSFWTM